MNDRETLLLTLRAVCYSQRWDEELVAIMVDECAPDGTDKVALVAELCALPIVTLNVV